MWRSMQRGLLNSPAEVHRRTLDLVQFRLVPPGPDSRRSMPSVVARLPPARRKGAPSDAPERIRVRQSTFSATSCL